LNGSITLTVEVGVAGVHDPHGASPAQTSRWPTISTPFGSEMSLLAWDPTAHSEGIRREADCAVWPHTDRNTSLSPACSCRHQSLNYPGCQRRALRKTFAKSTPRQPNNKKAPVAKGNSGIRVARTPDPDNDGTVDLNEAKAAAARMFDRLDRDKDGTLDKRELRGRLRATDFTVADPDKDGTLDKNEYMAVVEARFTAADPDKDGTLDASELRSRPGRALLRLVQ
jgi:hypothetical protein